MAVEGLSPVYGYLERPSMLDFAGHLAMVCFTAGCNLRCGYCHNAGLLGTLRPGLAWDRLDAACRAFSLDWVDAAVITGGEPTLHAGLQALIARFHEQGWAVKLDTNGTNPDRLSACLPLLDYVAMDIKTGLSGYAALTGFDDGDAIRCSVRRIREDARDYEFRTTVIPGLHDEAAVREMAGLLSGAKRWILQPFVPRDDLPDPRFRTMPRAQPETMEAVRRIAAEAVQEVVVRTG
ncbi:MAG: anaerobic ribonucleoside-triphosphate reductase activating protein [Lentisphaerae bacterium RIFOXYA12_FULL_60_10]|nr:MAG: anaerobic ribonucleoside-triphosphate reductase activating protein [Lentisphaerae bacterium RIFOXYA12_FULL_60_10]